MKNWPGGNTNQIIQPVELRLQPSAWVCGVPQRQHACSGHAGLGEGGVQTAANIIACEWMDVWDCRMVALQGRLASTFEGAWAVQVRKGVGAATAAARTLQPRPITTTAHKSSDGKPLLRLI
jgi:hypothetical protein